MATVELSYAPRTHAIAIHRGIDAHRFGAVVAHRRFGKTVCAINHLQVAALRCKRERPRFAFIGPTYTQAKSIVWDYAVHYSAVIPGVQPRVSELAINYPNGGQVRLFSADNPDSLRGLYFDGVVFDEYGLMPPRIFSEVVRPALSDRQGWALFLGTPAGKNQFYDVIQQAKTDPTWYHAEFKASETQIIPQAELELARKDMTADEYAQEYECSFEASVKGAIYAAELATARSTGRITRVPLDPILPVDTDWDLGVGDSTAIWFSQSLRSGELRVVDYYEASGEGLPHYAEVLRQKGYHYGQHWAPFDIQVKELGSGRSRLETAATLGIRFAIAPNVAFEDGIHAARMLFPRCYFDETRCVKGLEALQHYRREYNTRLNEFKPTAVHDWACFTPDTQVLTRSGTCRIMDLPNDGEVLTPCGWKRYEGPRLTRRNAQLVAVTLNDGSTVKCTPDHLWLTDDGWTCAIDLIPTTAIQSCSIASFNISMVVSTDSGRLSGISPEAARNYIEPCGSELLGRYPMGVTYTTVTATHRTTPSTISNVSLWTSTVSESTYRRINEDFRRSLVEMPPNGTPQKLADSGIPDTQSEPRGGRNGSVWSVPARIAAWFSRCWSVRLGTPRNTARKPARRLRIERVTVLAERADTCCIHVPDGECFTLANGAIVHNSHGADAFRYLALRQQTPRDKRPSGPSVRLPTGPDSWMS